MSARVPAERRVTITSDVVTRLWGNVEKTATCWLWIPALSSTGYGHMSVSNTKVLVHRLAYHIMRGPIPAGQELDHVCRVRHCVNPDHLEPVTHWENGKRGIGPSAINARKTHCVRGHEFTPENTYTPRTGGRRCRECMRLHDAARVPRRRPTKTTWRDA